MNSIYSPIRIQYLFCFFLCAFAFALPFSKYALSNSMFGLSACMLFIDTDHGIRWNYKISTHILSIVQKPVSFLLILFFATSILSLVWSSDITLGAHYFTLLLPLLFIPVAFAVHGKLSNWQIHLVLVFGIISIVVQLAIVLLHYYSNYSEINYSLLKGKPLSTPISHIRFSLLIAINIIILLYFILFQKYLFYKSEKLMYIITSIFLTIGLHILSVKTGLLCFYAGLGIFLFTYLKKKKLLKWFFILIPISILFFVLMIKVVPSLNAKFYHFLWQLGEYSRGNYRFFSDIERIQSIDFGWKLIQENPIFGTGIGDSHNSTNQIYKDYLNTSQVKLPHNQFIWSWAYCGLPCFFVLVLLLYYSIRQGLKSKSSITIAWILMLWISLMVEYGFGTQIGLCLLLFGFIITERLNQLEIQQGENL